jgi:hypothetical protein
MVKNRAKYRGTDGWGYALFDANGKLFECESVASRTQSCAACHHVVPERDYVFSRPAHLGKETFAFTAAKGGAALPFATKEAKDFPKEPAAALKGAGPVESLEGPLQKNAFSGTLDEVIPLLEARSAATGHAAALVVNDKNFSLVLPLAPTPKCGAGDPAKHHRILVHFNAKAVRDVDICR